MEPLVVSAAEAARMLNVKTATLQQELKAGNIYAYRDGRNWKIPVEALKNYVNARAETETEERRQTWNLKG